MILACGIAQLSFDLMLMQERQCDDDSQRQVDRPRVPDGGGGGRAQRQRGDGGARVRRRSQGERLRERRQQRVEQLPADVPGQRRQQELPPREDAVAARVQEVAEEHVQRRIAEVIDHNSSTMSVNFK